MSSIIEALKQRLKTDETLTSDNVSGSIVFDPDFPGFQGHFPGNPVLPGVCLIEAAVQLISHGAKRNLQLAEVENVKFFSPVNPGDEVKLDFSIKQLPGAVDAKGTMMSGERKICTIKLKTTVACCAG
jgi:3-hydroxyacyl-[acyl-carrier-protein] dehydratase